MANILDSLQYKIEKSRAEVVFGLKRIVWWLLILSLLLMVPAFFLGKISAKILINKNLNYPAINKISTLKPDLTIGPSNTLSYSDNNRGYYLKVSNKNGKSDAKKDVGYYPWVYDYVIKNAAGKEVETTQVVSYLLPNHEKYVIGPVSRDSGLKFEIRTNEEKSVPVRFNLQESPYPELPKIDVINSSIKNDSRTKDLVEISFIIKNQSNYLIKKVDNYFVIRNMDNRIIGVGRYTSDDLDALEQRTISLKYPNPNLGSNTTLEVIPEYNFMDQENLVLRVN